MLKSRFFALVALSCALFLAPTSPAHAAPRVAVWNPEAGTKEGRFKLDLEHLSQVTQWLKDAGIGAERVTAEINDTTQKFDALMLPGDNFPRLSTTALQKFAQDGGVLISLGENGRVPFLVGIEKKPDNTWTMAPRSPRSRGRAATFTARWASTTNTILANTIRA